MTLGKRLRELREERKIKQKEIAEYLHIKTNTYSKYENDERTPTIETIIKLSMYYKCGLDYMLEPVKKEINK